MGLCNSHPLEKQTRHYIRPNLGQLIEAGRTPYVCADIELVFEQGGGRLHLPQDGAAAQKLHARYAGAFERSYQDLYSTRTAVSDIRQLEALSESGGLRTQLRQQPEDATITENWKNLLFSVGLGAIATQPVSQ